MGTNVGADWPHVNLSALVATTCLALFVCCTFETASSVVQSILNAPQFTKGTGVKFLASVVCWARTKF